MAEGFPQDRKPFGASSAELPLEWVLGKEGMASAIILAVLTVLLDSDYSLLDTMSALCSSIVRHWAQTQIGHLNPNYTLKGCQSKKWTGIKLWNFAL